MGSEDDVADASKMRQLMDEVRAGREEVLLLHVYCGETAGLIKMPFGTEVGLSPGTLCYMGTQLRPHKGHSSPQFSARVYCGHVAGWINMPPGTELGLSAGDTALGDT